MLQIRGTDGNAILDALTVCDTLEIYGGLQGVGVNIPAKCSYDQTGDLIMAFDLTSTTWGLASGGRLSISGLPIAAVTNVLASPAYFRLLLGGVCKMQGTCTPSGYGGDMQFPSNYVNAGATFILSELLFIEVNNDV
jgi:hypothetical protein